MHKNNINRVIVLDIKGVEISTTWTNRAMKMIYKNKAELVSDNPLTIRLLNEVKDNCGEVDEK